MASWEEVAEAWKRAGDEWKEADEAWRRVPDAMVQGAAIGLLGGVIVAGLVVLLFILFSG